MTYHSWVKIEDEFTDKIIDSLVEGIRYNANAIAFGLFSYGDKIMYVCGQYVKKYDCVDKMIVEDIVPSEGIDNRDKIVDDILLVLEKYYDN